ncbi:unnamed protein product [Ectocarpus sp. 4 AP-2014]
MRRRCYAFQVRSQLWLRANLIHAKGDGVYMLGAEIYWASCGVTQFSRSSVVVPHKGTMTCRPIPYCSAAAFSLSFSTTCSGLLQTRAEVHHTSGVCGWHYFHH